MNANTAPTTFDEQPDPTGQDQDAPDAQHPDPDTTEPEPTEQDPEGEDAGPSEGDHRVDKARGQAARYRRALREVEAERDGLAARLDTMQRAEAEKIATSMKVFQERNQWGHPVQSEEWGKHWRGWLHSGSDLWRDGLTLEDVLTDGQVDKFKVDHAVAVLAKTHPHWINRPRHASAAEVGLGGGGAPAHHGTTFTDFLGKSIK